MADDTDYKELTTPIARYNGDDVTCYPSSNAKDDGKIQLEFNMARLVTRLSSKNFCIVNPSFGLTVITDSTTGKQIIKVAEGQASINGMDLIMISELTIDPPEEAGHYYLKFKLARDSSNNVMGDFTSGVTKIFRGVYLCYSTEKVDDVDGLYLGSFDYDGSNITNLEEDEDKYGNLWADDILCKVEDPKHPDVTRITLQDYIYNLPNYYVSKEGDVIYGQLTFINNIIENKTGILMNVDDESSGMVFKYPYSENEHLYIYGDVTFDGTVTQEDYDLIYDYIYNGGTLTDLQLILADVNHDGIVDDKDLGYIQAFLDETGENAGDTGNIYYIDTSSTTTGIEITVVENGSTLDLEKGTIYSNSDDDYTLHIHNDGDICMDAEGDLTIEADGKIEISTENAFSPVVTIDDDKISITDPTASDLEFSITYPNSTTIQQTLGKAIWQYTEDDEWVSLLTQDVVLLDVKPNGYFEKNLTVQNTIYIGELENTTQTYLKQLEWKMCNLEEDPTKYITYTPDHIALMNTTLSSSDNSYIMLQNANNTIHTEIFDDAKIELLNPTRNPSIVWKDGTSTYDVTLYKYLNEKRLNIGGSLTVGGDIIASGDITGDTLISTGGQIQFTNGEGTATITKDDEDTDLRSNGNVYIGNNGEKDLYAGNVTVNGELGVGGDTYENSDFQVDSDGNVTTSGEISASRIYGACYNGVGEVFKKHSEDFIEYGDIVCIDNDGYVRKVEKKEDLDYIVGICSDTIGFELGTANVPETEQVEVEVLGQIWVKTHNTRLQPREMVKALPDGTVDFTTDKNAKFGITLTGTINDKVKIWYNG